jgi:hypothetical protein
MSVRRLNDPPAAFILASLIFLANCSAKTRRADDPIELKSEQGLFKHLGASVPLRSWVQTVAFSRRPCAICRAPPSALPRQHSQPRS